MFSRRLGRLFGLAPLVILASLLPAAAVGAQTTNGPLTSHERARLETGAIVERHATERRAGLELMGGTSFQVVELPPE
ncbi:MAG: hypothetical protein OEY14_12665, partial [Myxococcales bacterium]|nr:hypothetical protein [Myxococcales bacterium]